MPANEASFTEEGGVFPGSKRTYATLEAPSQRRDQEECSDGISKQGRLEIYKYNTRLMISNDSRVTGGQ